MLEAVLVCGFIKLRNAARERKTEYEKERTVSYCPWSGKRIPSCGLCPDGGQCSLSAYG